MEYIIETVENTTIQLPDDIADRLGDEGVIIMRDLPPEMDWRLDSAETHNDMMKKLSTLDLNQVVGRHLQRFILGSARELRIDDKHRLTLPADIYDKCAKPITILIDEGKVCIKSADRDGLAFV